jgi:hypothetical protein
MKSFHWSILPALLLGAAIAMPATEGRASVFGFAADPSNYITDYQGFTWSGSAGAYSWVNANTPSYSLSGATPAAPLGYAWSNGTADLSMSSTAAFAINSVDVYADITRWGGAVPVLPLTIDGYSNGILVDSLTTPVLDTTQRRIFDNNFGMDGY